MQVHTEDGFSNLICQRCKSLVLAFNFFKESCQDSQQRLKRMSQRKQVMEFRRMPEEMVVEEESRLIFEDTGPEKEVEIPPPSQGESVCSSDGAVRPLAIWTVTKDGQFRANTVTVNNEMIVNELLDDITPTGGASMEKEVAVEELHTEKNRSNHLEHHNYCSRPETKEDTEDESEKETTIAEEEEWIKAANEDRTVLMESLKEPPSPREPLVNKRTNEAESERCKNPEEDHLSMAQKESCDEPRFLETTQGVVRIRNTDFEFRRKILISQNSKHVLRIPAVQAEPINEKNKGDPVLKVSKTLQCLDEAKALHLKQKLGVKGFSKGYKTLLISKGDKMVKLVSDRSRRSNISFLKIKDLR
ncbi:hypothetical protein J437_LFUL005995 [Ladona fulva]|uniref:Uncharacterized protein n=1 Tax=Ladona fulva TaxID=123851 RepID=A0A8K0JZM2_LADFU|nr:hypothetical protein J437_LFUL005995 [Ladona fulva]